MMQDEKRPRFMVQKREGSVISASMGGYSMIPMSVGNNGSRWPVSWSLVEIT